MSKELWFIYCILGLCGTYIVTMQFLHGDFKNNTYLIIENMCGLIGCIWMIIYFFLQRFESLQTPIINRVLSFVYIPWGIFLLFRTINMYRDAKKTGDRKIIRDMYIKLFIFIIAISYIFYGFVGAFVLPNL